ncbi:MAG TPA: hypothetical protein VFQ68_45425, partial [Streptosporangiaceae bacterium]|nr:hypothetical protein [Streptosporangiaceae bacterium]
TNGGGRAPEDGDDPIPAGAGAGGNAVLAVAAMASAGWLFLLVVLLAAPPSPGPRRGGGPGDGTSDGTAGGTVREPDGDEPPAVVSLLAGKLDWTGFGATLAGLAARGWFQVRPLAPPPGPAMCVVPAEAPGGSLTPCAWSRRKRPAAR